MNYIMLHKSYGAVSLQMTQDKMNEEVILLAKTTKNGWQSREKNAEWKTLPSLQTVLTTGNNRMINWGNHIFADDDMFDLNVPSGVSFASNKRNARAILQGSGVRVPFTVFPRADVAGSLAGLTYPVIVRPAMHHGGQHFHVVNTFEKLRAFLWGKDVENWYVSNIFQKTTEYRVHCGHGKVLFIQEKPLVEGEIRANQAVNHESWTVLKWSDFHKGVCRESLLAIEALGLDYGAVDIMYNSVDDSWAICEVNTSPSINTPYSSEKYAAYFDWVIRHDFPEHFSLENQESYTFYSKMLRE